MSEDTLTMIPGPTPVRPSILDALARPTTSHQDPGFVGSFRECLQNLRAIARTTQAHPFVVSGAGTLAMEMALVNLVAPGERLLVLSHGYFGDRWGQLAGAFGIEHRVVQAEWGHAIEADRLAAELRAGSWSAVAATHVDTSTGTAAPVADYAEVMRGREELFLLDGVCATAGMDEPFDAWGLDVLLTGAQKALGAPPGVAVLLVSERALARRENRASVPAYYADLLRWKPVMDEPSRYFSTPPVNEVLALLEATRLVLAEGLEERFARHRAIARAMRAGLAELELFPVTAEGRRAETLSVLRYPEGVDDTRFRAAVAERGVVIAGALGPLAGRACRVGHMGNIGSAEVRRTLAAMGGAMRALGRDADVDRALAAAEAC